MERVFGFWIVRFVGDWVVVGEMVMVKLARELSEEGGVDWGDWGEEVL